MARRIKLERFDLWRYFRCGAFGDDAPDRNALVPVALERAAACGMPGVSRLPTSSSSATRRTTSPARRPSAPCPSAWRRAGYTADQLRACGAEVVFETLEDSRFGRLRVMM